MEYPAKWEIITENTRRMKTPEGWIVHNVTHVIVGDKAVSVSECGWKVIDPDHTWNLTRG